jgi:superfamily II DNA or RNA helicase/HKD family nuclease
VTAPRKELIPGLYEDLIDEALDELLLLQLDDASVQITDKLDPTRSAEAFARHLYMRSRLAFERIGDVEAQRRLADELLVRLEAGRVKPPTRQLLAVADPSRAGLAAQRFPDRPGIPLAESELLVNARGQLSMGTALTSELASADRVDLICAFIKRAGLARLEPALRKLTEGRPDRLRVLTTVYTGATEVEALERLVALGATVKVDYEGRATRLHAKAWLLHRNSGLTTAYVGSSNISHSALVDGREWNVRLSARENPDLITKLAAEFAALWAEPDAFQPFEPQRFAQARSRERGSFEPDPTFVRFDLRPYRFQELILDQLAAARELHDQHRNLVVAATGTGKTMIAAFDYARQGPSRPRLLFVAHRKEILQQAMASFRGVLGDREFGELLVDGRKPSEAKHVFASIQSLGNRLDAIRPRYYDFVIIDEFHHAEASTYQRLLARLNPRELLGLTATPERGDGKDVTHFFGGRITAELRLWEALDRALLCPFQYFGVGDGVDLEHVTWRQSGYDRAELEQLYTGDHARVGRILQAVQHYVPAPESMRALGFCVGIEHARFMAKQFSQHGVPAAAVVGTDDSRQRDAALASLRAGQIRVLFCVDVFNEGVDLPEVDTLLFLRPTESATLFLQQLGRGLRNHPGKLATTVLDFIGNAHRNFRFDRKFRALLADGAGVVEQIEHDFPWLPPGCAIVLESQPREIVLANVRQALEGRRPAVVSELRALARAGDLTLNEFLDAMQWQPEQLYRDRDRKWTYTKLRQDAGIIAAAELDGKIANSLANLVHVDDRLRLTIWQRWLSDPKPPKLAAMEEPERRLATMLLAVLIGGGMDQIHDLASGLRRLWQQPDLLDEARQLLAIVGKRVEHLDSEFIDRPNIPLRLHAHYTRDELLAACGALRAGKDPKMQTGMRLLANEKAILNLITIDKQTGGYSPKTQYRDYALSRTSFHSESPHTAGPDTPFGRHLLNHAEEGLIVLLFVRPRRDDERGITAPYVFLGPTCLREAIGDRPMQLTWELTTPIPAWFYPQACLTT